MWNTDGKIWMACGMDFGWLSKSRSKGHSVQGHGDWVQWGSMALWVTLLVQRYHLHNRKAMSHTLSRHSNSTESCKALFTDGQRRSNSPTFGRLKFYPENGVAESHGSYATIQAVTPTSIFRPHLLVRSTKLNMASVAQGEVALSSVCNALVRAAGRLSGHHRLWATENLEAMLSFALLTNRRGLKSMWEC